MQLSPGVSKFVFRTESHKMIYPYKTAATLKTRRYVIHPTELLAYWQDHRAHTKQLIETFSEETFFNYSIGELRPFSEIVRELIRITSLAVRVIIKEVPLQKYQTTDLVHSKARLLALWDETTFLINTNWDQLSLERFHETVSFWTLKECKVYEAIFYLIDNEIHHRGQACVYLRSLGVRHPIYTKIFSS